MIDGTGNSFATRPATLDDAESLAGLANACSIELTGKPRVTGRYVRSVLSTPGVNLETDTLLVFGSDDTLSGYGLVQDSAPHTMYLVLADVHPEYRGRGIGSALCRWGEERSQRSTAGAPAGERIVLWQQRLSNDLLARELLTARGYSVVRHNYRMVAELDEPPPQAQVPAGICIRRFSREQEARALIRALLEAFRDNWGFVERPFEEEHRRWMHMLDRDPDNDPAPFWFVAVDGEEIAGFCLCSPTEAGDPDTAWVSIVGVRAHWRRRGLALALLRRSFGALYEHGKRRIALEVDTESRTGATRLYEKAGMLVDRRYDFYELELRERGKQ